MDPDLTAATRSRDEAQARARGLTWWAAVAATAVTGIGAGIAASTIPGHTVAQAQAASQPAGGATSADPSTGIFNPPAQPPDQGGAAPVIVSGGS